MIFLLPVPLKRDGGERTKGAYADSGGLKSEKEGLGDGRKRRLYSKGYGSGGADTGLRGDYQRGGGGDEADSQHQPGGQCGFRQAFDRRGHDRGYDERGGGHPHH